MTNLESYRSRINQIKTQHDLSALQVKTEQTALAENYTRYENAEQARTVLQQLAQLIQESAHLRIASVVTKCLESVFPDDPYEFKIEFDRKRGKTEANLQFVRDGVVLDDPIRQAGGGAIDVASFALMVACLVLSRPQRRRLLVLDEPFRFLSSGYRLGIRAMVDALAKELDIQFVIVTHASELMDKDTIELC